MDGAGWRAVAGLGGSEAGREVGARGGAGRTSGAGGGWTGEGMVEGLTETGGTGSGTGCPVPFWVRPSGGGVGLTVGIACVVAFDEEDEPRLRFRLPEPWLDEPSEVEPGGVTVGTSASWMPVPLRSAALPAPPGRDPLSD